MIKEIIDDPLMYCLALAIICLLATGLGLLIGMML